MTRLRKKIGKRLYKALMNFPCNLFDDEIIHIINYINGYDYGKKSYGVWLQKYIRERYGTDEELLR